jgi:hypothetical protein
VKTVYAGTPGPGGLFNSVDYWALETRMLRQAGKNLSFGMPQGIAPSGVLLDYAENDTVFSANTCKRCGKPKYYGGHDRRQCSYDATERRYSKLGCVRVTGMVRKALKLAGIELYWGIGQVSAETLRYPNLRREPWERKQKKQKTGEKRPMQRTYYAPVWAVILYEMSDIGALTNPKRPKVRELITQLKRASEDPELPAIIATEHILGKGPYTVACQALVGRSKR